MALGRAIGFAAIGLFAGAVLGGAAGLAGGLGYISLAETSGFEGYAGFVVLYWILAGIVLGAIAGAIGGVLLAHRGDGVGAP
jgi:hypothetical protein